MIANSAHFATKGTCTHDQYSSQSRRFWALGWNFLIVNRSTDTRWDKEGPIHKQIPLKTPILCFPFALWCVHPHGYLQIRVEVCLLIKNPFQVQISCQSMLNYCAPSGSEYCQQKWKWLVKSLEQLTSLALGLVGAVYLLPFLFMVG